MDNAEIKQLLHDAFREQNEKWTSYLTVGREDIARMQVDMAHVKARVDSLNVFVVTGNGEKGLIVRVPKLEELYDKVENLEAWKATAQKRETWLKLVTVIIGGLSALILAWTQLQK